MSNIKSVTDQEFQKEVLESPIPVMIDFWAPWCHPCRALAPIIEELAEKFEGRVKIMKINVDENPETPIRYGVRGIPTVILFMNGKVVEQFVGLTTLERLEQTIKNHLTPEFD